MIQLLHVSKSYDDAPALKRIDLEIEKGELVFLTGPSGAGKTTLLRLVMSAEPPTEGQVIIAGRNVARIRRGAVPHVRRNIGVVFQDFQLIPNRTALENVAVPLEVLGTPAREVRRRAAAILEQVGLGHQLDSLPERLSGGEQQRVAIARAAIGRPAILLADEPTGNLDPDLTLEVMTLLTSLSERGTTVLVATHDRSILERFPRRVVHLEGGRIVADTRPEEESLRRGDARANRLPQALDRGSATARTAYAFRKAIAAVRAAPMPHVVAIASIAAALVLCAIVGATLAGTRSLVSAWSHRAELTAYLAPGTSESEAARLADLAEEISQGSVRYVSPDAALASLAASMGDAGKDLLELGENPLSGSLEIDLGSRPPEEKEAIAGRLAVLAGVEEVDRGEALASRMDRIAGAAETVASVLLPVLLLGAAVLVGSVVRLGVHERRREISILRLVGATDGFIRAPLWVEGTLSGLVGGVVAAAGIVGVSLGAGSRLAGALELPPQLAPVALANPLLLAAVVVLGGVVGLVATALSVERHLR